MLQSTEAKAANWYGLRVRSKFEQTTSAALEARDCEVFLPVVRTRRRWSDRAKEIDTPLFPGYVFCRFHPAQRVPVLGSPGVVNIVGFGNEPACIPDHEIEAVKAMLRSSLPIFPHPFLTSGQRIRIGRGPLDTGAAGATRCIAMASSTGCPASRTTLRVHARRSSNRSRSMTAFTRLTCCSAMF